ncbi:MAG: FTR1 family protein [Candidatus Levybacteria bacterium]|nr:FTR1 family protein [Candidatus Levybacteria bacterium]
MFSSLLITFRETLEAALVVGIVITFLTKTNQQIFKKFVWQGVFSGIGLAVLVAVVLEAFFGGFEGRAEEIFEGILMFVTAGFLTWMILWVHRQKDVAKRIKEKVALHAQKGYGIGILILIASSVFREGVETVLYLKASSLAGASNQLAGAVFGILLALGLGYVLFRWAIRINLSLVFNVTSIFLLLFAAGLVAHGVHEFQEAGLLPIFTFDPVLNISHILDHKSTLGSLLRVVFGYTSKPTILELVSYSSYVVFILWLQRFTDRILLKRAS